MSFIADFCEPNPCLYSGICRNDFIDDEETPGYWCQCEPGFGGDRCEIRPLDICLDYDCGDRVKVGNPETNKCTCVCKAGETQAGKYIFKNKKTICRLIKYKYCITHTNAVSHPTLVIHL